MNTAGLAKQYTKLTPQERFPLLVAAAQRGDDTERKRLMHTAPVRTFQVPDYYGFALAFREVADRHVQTLLNLAANYYRAILAASDETDDGELLAAALAIGYVFRVNLQGWEKLCAEFAIDSHVVLGMFPEYDIIRDVLDATQNAALEPEGADRHTQRLVGEAARAMTPADIHAASRAALIRRAEWWRGTS
jgi:hypothetical protein